MSLTTVGADLRVLERAEWQARAADHAARVAEWTRDRTERAARGRSHPVEDFLFTYYPTRPGRLSRWHPGLGVAVLGVEPATLGTAYVGITVEGRSAVTVDPGAFARRRDGLAWVEGLVRRTAGRPARLGCFGLHEWAMVYDLAPEEIRHESWPLRLDPARIR
ncbi:MAG TPA: 3-methyladenine DNA glycosylase, partial [Candidatus Eisenbacteria bacterium]|nr:3-methyladenine DNA glycosylase [Candidatus Eisenbacteria bacterium]